MKRKSKKKPKYYVAQAGLDLRNRPKYVTEDEINAPPEPVSTKSPVYEDFRKGIIEPQRGVEEYPYDPSIDQAYNQQQRQQQRPSFFEKNEFSPAFKAFNTAALGVTAIASKINNLKTDKDERQQYLDAINPPAWENMERYGLNTNPVFTKFGGKVPKYQVGGSTRNRNLQPSAEALAAANAEAKRFAKSRNMLIGEDAYVGNQIPEYIDSATGKLYIPTPTKQRATTVPDYVQFSDLKSEQGLYWYDDPKTGDTVDIDPLVFNLPRFKADSAKQKGLSSTQTSMTKFKFGGVKYQVGGKPTPEQLTAANMEAKRFAKARGLLIGESAYVGDTLPQYIDSATGKPYIPTPTKPRATTVPSYINFEDIKSEQGIHYYVDPQTGDTVDVDPLVYNLPRFKADTAKQKNLYTDRLTKSTVSPTNIPTFQLGGASVKKVEGLPDAGKKFANVEAEKGEVVEGLNGTIAQVDPNGNTHEQGGEFIPNVQRVLENTSDLRKDKDSKYLKLEPKQILALTGMNTRQSMSHAKALVKADEQYEKQRGKIVGKIELASRDNDELNKYAENSTKLNLDHFKSIPTKDVLFENLFNHQELVKKNLDIKDDGTSKKGGYVYKNGGLSREEDRGSDKKPYPSVKSSDFAGGDRSYPIPTKADAIDALRLAGLHGRSDVRAKVYAKYPELKKQAGGLVPYKGNKSGKKTPAGNPDAYVGDLNKNLEELKSMGFNYEGITDPRDFQTALYNKKIDDKKFDDIREMWKEGMHEQGMQQARNLGYVDDKGNFLPGVLDKEENLRKLGELYPDGILGRRTMQLARGKKIPPRIWEDQDTPDQLTEVPENKPVDTSITNNVQLLDQPKSKFNEPLRWFDVASPIGTYMSALERLPEKYNPAEFNQLRYKLLDPTVALQQNQADFNASVQAVQGSGSNSGAAMANIANLASKKYAMNNQVLGNYENQNAQIKNQEILYNTQVRDKQSVADQQAREVFENKVLTGKAKQQEQKLTALDSLYKTIAENRALNRNGNLIMKFSRAFDQYGDYNGYQTKFQVNPTLGVNPAGGNQASSGKIDAAGGIQNLTQGKSYYNRKSGKVLRFDGVNLIEVK